MDSSGVRRLAVLFFLAGFLLSNWVVRIPDVKDHIGASSTTLGLALLCQSLGGLVAMAVASRLILRFGARRMNLVGGLGTGLAVVLPTLSGSSTVLAAALVVLGLAYGTFNIALNSAAVDVERELGRPVMSTLHGLYSAGGLGGATLGGLAAAALPPTVHVGIVAALGVVVVIAVGATDGVRTEPAALAGKDTTAKAVAGPGFLLSLMLAVIAFCTAFAEFSAVDWSVLHVREDLMASATTAAWALSCYELAMTIGRFTGGRLIVRFGAAAVLIWGAGLALVGGLIAAWAGSVPSGGILLSYAGYLALGLGMANVFPIVIARAGALGGPKAVSLTAMSSTIAIMIERPIIGFLADRIGLPAALSGVAILIALISLLAVYVSRSTPQNPQKERVPTG